MSGVPRVLHSVQLIWTGVLAGLVLVAVLVLVLAGARSEVPTVLSAALVAAMGAAAIVGVEAVDRTFAAAPPENDRAALTEYRVRFVLQIAILEAPVLLAVAMAFVLGPAWIIALGAGGAFVALLRVRPSLARLRRFDATWQAAGHDVSLVRATTAARVEP